MARQGRRRGAWIAAGAIAISVVAAALLARGGRGREESIPVFRVQEGPLTISVTASGSIQSRDKVVITSELEGNNTVLWVIEEGTNVQAGDLLLEFDASELLEKRKEQEVTVASAEANLIVAQEKLGITQDDSESALIDRETDMVLAQMAMEKYLEGEYPQLLRQNEADIALADEEVQRAAERLEWSRRLAAEGFLTRTELQADELALRRKQIDLDMARTRLSVLTNFTMVQQRSTLKSALRRAERAQARTEWQNRSALRQDESDLRRRQREWDRATNRLALLDFQINKSRIVAPTNGIVLYTSTVQISRRQWWVRPLAVGSTAVQRQELIYIPIESGMVVEVMIPESSLNKIGVGMPARVRIDAFPGRVFEGRLARIGILPDGQSSQLNPDLKLYKCEVECDFRDVVIRPGMSCDVELIKEHHDVAIFVPVQCVVRHNGVPYVHVRAGGGWEARAVEVGFDNNRMIHVLGGLRAGEEVKLAPPVKTRSEEPPAAALRENGESRPGETGQNGGET